MPRASKPISACKGHRTKSEIRAREQAESDLLTGSKISEKPETKSDKLAHGEFLRVSKLFHKIGKNDALYTSVINRYCVLYSECMEFKSTAQTTLLLIQEFEKSFKEYIKQIDDNEERLKQSKQVAKILSDLYRRQQAIDSQIMTKRKMMFDIEKENLMTIQSALRSIPKEPERQGDAMSELKKALAFDD